MTATINAVKTVKKSKIGGLRSGGYKVGVAVEVVAFGIFGGRISSLTTSGSVVLLEFVRFLKSCGTTDVILDWRLEFRLDFFTD